MSDLDSFRLSGDFQRLKMCSSGTWVPLVCGLSCLPRLPAGEGLPMTTSDRSFGWRSSVKRLSWKRNRRMTSFSTGKQPLKWKNIWFFLACLFCSRRLSRYSLASFRASLSFFLSALSFSFSSLFLSCSYFASLICWLLLLLAPGLSVAAVDGFFSLFLLIWAACCSLRLSFFTGVATWRVQLLQMKYPSMGVMRLSCLNLPQSTHSAFLWPIHLLSSDKFTVV